MNRPLLKELPPEEQDDLPEFYFGDRFQMMAKIIPFRHKGVARPGHAHTYDHDSYVVRGSIRAWAGDRDLGVFKAPASISIKAGVFHTYLAEEDDTIVMCVHNTHGHPPDEREKHLIAERTTG
jgi:quercetin dioxygenase-like cupin family protein